LSKAVFICEVHSDFLHRGFLPVKDYLAAKLILQSTDFVRAVNTKIAERSRAWGAKKVLMIPSIYINLEVFKPTLSQRERGPVVLSASRLVPQKGLELLIKSAQHLSSKFKGLEIRIVGLGPEERRLKNLAKELNVEDVVKFLGWVSRDDLVKSYNEASVFVCTSFHEGGPRTVFEAAACQTPFVSTAVGLIPEVFTHGHEGFIIRERDEKVLAHYISRLLENPDLREEMGRRARMVVEKTFEWNAAVRRYATAYLEILTSKHFTSRKLK
ncbi:MAG: glycosyltransferase, partial [Candidatus Caldarchaeum sp.]|nr:glycosyltransferase [Candidatus Caldarchaeum sp.]MDW8435900.1 glycosyltransferase [Candidatus Caldarchaeum sp.]